MRPSEHRFIPPELPVPDEQARDYSLQLVARLRQQIETAGALLPFHRYMEQVLYAPQLGYYSGGAHKFGAAGDFVTSPEISPVFAQCLARQYRQLDDLLGGCDILEFGAGSGALAVDLLAELQRLDRLPQRYRIIELSADLRQRQRLRIEQALPDLLERVEWLDRLPQGFRGLIIANEVLDAMPVSRFRIERGEVLEQFVVCEGERFSLQWGAAQTAGLEASVRRIFDSNLPEDYESEINLFVTPWIESLADTLEAGLVLLIDYGYGRDEFYHPRRSRGTLICHYRHRAHEDPLVYPGLQDITANVDFTAVAEAGLAAGLELAGYTTQAFFLMGCGLDRILASSDPDQVGYIDLVQGVKRLTLPTEMGERFKVLGLSRDIPLPLIGFSLREQREKL